MPADLLVQDLFKRYGRVEALRGVSFAVVAGQIFGLLGPNGAGKTTTIECALGLRRPDSGAITVAGIDAIAHPNRIKPLVGAQLQSTALQQKITPRQALKLFGNFYPNRVEPNQLLDQFDLVGKADSPFDSLSGGQQQRLALALAFVNDPKIVLLDEPTAGLDPLARRQLHGMIRQARDAGRTILLCTHYVEEAEQLCDAVAIVDGGKVVASGSPSELIAGAAAASRVIVRTARPLAGEVLAAHPAIRSARAVSDRWELETMDINRLILSIVQLLQRQGNDLLDLQIQRPSLEDVYLRHTGRAWENQDAAALVPS